MRGIGISVFRAVVTSLLRLGATDSSARDFRSAKNQAHFASAVREKHDANHLSLFALAVILASLPLYVVRFTVAGIPTTLFEVILLTGLVIAFTVLARQKRLHMTPLYAWALLLIAIGTASLLVTPDTRAALGLLKAYIIEPALFGVAVAATVRTKDDILFLLKTLTIPALLVSIIALAQYVTGFGITDPWSAWPGRRATAIYGYPNAVGLFLAPIASMCLAVAIHWSLSIRTRLLFAITTVLALGAILAAQSHGALLSFCIAAMITLLFTRFRTAAILLAGAGLIILLVLPQTRSVLTFQDTSGDVRLALWEGTARLLQAQPLTGAGLAGFPQTYDTYRNAAHTELLQHPHNMLLNFWVELGIAGAVWLIGTIILFARLLSRSPSRPIQQALLAAMICTLIYGLVDVPYFKNDLSILFWLWLALAYTAYTKSIR